MSYDTDRITAELHSEALGNLKAELESLRQENARLREALEKIACWKFETVPGLIPWPVETARAALNPPKTQ